MRNYLNFSCLITGILIVNTVIADDYLDADIESLQKLVNLANGSPTPLDKTPAIATVITAEDIAAMGATTLDEVMMTVPGIMVNKQSFGGTSRYIIRGIVSPINTQTLIKVNGTPVNSLTHGGTSTVWTGLPLKSIERIEIIRGPGSALHGAAALAGVIDIRTRTTQSLDGLTGGASAGSFDTQSVWLNWGGESTAVTLNYMSTDGHTETVNADLQTRLDDFYGTDASNAPGPAANMVRTFDARFDTEFKGIAVKAGYHMARDLGTGVGIGEALDPAGRWDSDSFNLNLSYQMDITDQLKLTPEASYYRNTRGFEEPITYLPAGTIRRGFTYEDGIIGSPAYKEEQIRFELNALYTVEQHVLRGGLGGYYGDVYEVRELRSFSGDFEPLEEPIYFDDTDDIYLPENMRKNYFIYLQDEFQINDLLRLTSGIRYDHYSDFGSTVNPRIALVWAVNESLTTKLLYGSAFRAPSMMELYTQNPVSEGNPDLGAETMDTYEVGLTWQHSRNTTVSANAFYYELEDVIEYETIDASLTRPENNGGRRGHGFEMEFNSRFNRHLKFTANYAYQISENTRTNHSVGETPTHQAYMRGQYQGFSAELHYIGSQPREANDPREKVEEFTLTNLRYNFQLKGLGISVIAKNIFNSQAFDPSPYASGRLAIPGDIPRARRAFELQLEYSF